MKKAKKRQQTDTKTAESLIKQLGKEANERIQQIEKLERQALKLKNDLSSAQERRKDALKAEAAFKRSTKVFLKQVRNNLTQLTYGLKGHDAVGPYRNALLLIDQIDIMIGIEQS
jgi:hypothetical protein